MLLKKAQPILGFDLGIVTDISDIHMTFSFLLYI